MNEFITIDMLKVFAVAVSITVMLTEFSKEAVDWIFSKLKINIHTKYVVFFFALVVIFLPFIIEKLITVEAIFTGVLNAVLLSLTAMKSYDTIRDRTIAKINREKEQIDSIAGE